MNPAVFLAYPTGCDSAWWRVVTTALADAGCFADAPNYEEADGIFAVLPPGSLSLGVPIAIGYGYGRYLPTCILFDAQTRHFIHGKCDHVGVFYSRDIDQAIAWLKEKLT